MEPKVGEDNWEQRAGSASTDRLYPLCRFRQIPTTLQTAWRTYSVSAQNKLAIVMKNEKRKWIERLAVSIVRALNVSGVSQTKTILYARLWLRPGVPWTISALAEATSLDRATIREHMNSCQSDHIVRSENGFALTSEGEREAYRVTQKFYKSIAPKDRYYIKQFFSTKYAGQSPYRKLSEFLIDLDRCTRRIPYSISFRTVLSAMDILAPRGTQWTISELSKETAYSYQAVHKVVHLFVEQGLANQTDKTFAITTKGRVKCVGFFFFAIRRADMRLLKMLVEMVMFNNPPSTLLFWPPSITTTTTSSARPIKCNLSNDCLVGPI
jgi:hypothetical protein